MLTVARVEFAPYLDAQRSILVRHHAGPGRWQRWLEERQSLQVFGWQPTTCQEGRMWRFVPRLTATYVRLPDDTASWGGRARIVD